MEGNILQQLFDASKTSFLPDAFIEITIVEATNKQHSMKFDELTEQFQNCNRELKAVNQIYDHLLKSKSSDEKQKITQDPVKQKPEKLDVHFSKRRLYITGFHSTQTTADELMTYFSKYGDIEDISFLDCKPYAFITFASYYKFPPVYHKFKGREITIRTLDPFNDPAIKTKTILVNGVLNDLSEESMKKYFTKYGKVENVKKHRNGVVKRFAYITFRDPESVEEVVKTPVHLIDDKIVDLRKAIKSITS